VASDEMAARPPIRVAARRAMKDNQLESTLDTAPGATPGVRRCIETAALTVAIVLLGGPAVAVADKLDDAYQGLQEAVAKKDVAQVKKLAAEAAPLVGDALATPAPGAPTRSGAGPLAWTT